MTAQRNTEYRGRWYKGKRYSGLAKAHDGSDLRDPESKSSHDCDTIEAAFDRCSRMKMWAMARPVNTTCGCYSWDPSKGHTLDGFRSKLALCCNDPAEYSRNLIAAGICREVSR